MSKEMKVAVITGIFAVLAAASVPVVTWLLDPSDEILPPAEEIDDNSPPPAEEIDDIDALPTNESGSDADESVAVETNSDFNMQWSREDNTYFLYFNGELINAKDDSKFLWVEDDGLIYYLKNEQYYLLEDYRTKGDGAVRPARPIASSNGTLWKRKDDIYWLYINGEMAENNTVEFSWLDDSNDALLYYPDRDQYYRLEDYKIRADNMLRPTELIASDNGTLWKRQGETYWLYVDGIAAPGDKTEFAWEGDNGVIYYSENGQHYLLEDYMTKADGIFRSARLVDR